MTAPDVRTPGGNRANAEKKITTISEIVVQVGDTNKARATLRARLALLGYSLHELSGGSFLVCRWDRGRHLIDLNAVSAFLRQVGGAN